MKMLLDIISFLIISQGFQMNMPPKGMVKIVNNLYVDANEVSNVEWRGYLSALRYSNKKASFVYQSALPDTTVWRANDSSYIDPMVEQYFRHIAFNNYPVLGLSHSQAVDYCKWRTDQYQQKVKHTGTQKVVFRLPSQIEWQMIDRLNNTKQSGIDQKSHKNIPLFNFHEKEGNPFFTAPAYSFISGKLGLFHWYGNVAEMVQEEGIAMGGSWKDQEADVLSSPSKPYKGPNSWVGFRCVCEIVVD